MRQQWVGEQMAETSENEKKSQQDISLLPRWRQSLYVGMFWVFMVFSIYTVIFISWYGCLVPGIFAQLLYSFAIKKNKLEIIPCQKQLTAWLHATRFYDRFVRRPNADKGLRLLKKRGFLLIFVGLIPLVLHYSRSPVVDLEDMKVVRGTFEGYSKRGRKHPCGKLLLSIRLKDGTLAKYHNTGTNLNTLNETIGMDVTIWEKQTSHSIFPECREFPRMAQIQSKGYSRSYNKQRSKKISLWLLIIGTGFTASGSVIIAYIFFKNINHTRQSNIKKEQ